MILSLGVFGAYFYFKEHSIQDKEGELPGWIPLMALMVYVVSFSIGFGPIPWLMMGEVFPSRIRGAAASFATALNWGFTFLVTKTFMDLQVIYSKYVLEFSLGYKSLVYVIMTLTILIRNTFFFSAPTLWNNLVSPEQANAPSVEAFKRHFSIRPPNNDQHGN